MNPVADRQCAHGDPARFDCVWSTLRLGHMSLLSPSRLMPGLRLTQNWIGKSFAHAIFGPYLQRCGNKLRVLVCIDVEHLAPTHANNVDAVVVIG